MLRTNDAKVVRSPVTLINGSSVRGMKRTTAIPTAGMKTTRVSNQASNPCAISRFPLTREPQDEAEQPHRGDDEQRVELQAAGLQLARRAPRFRCTGRDPVDRAVDGVLIDVAIGR